MTYFENLLILKGKIMIETGKVIEIRGNIAKVELDSSSRCSSCSMADSCGLLMEGKRYIEAESLALIRVGDKVQVEIKGGLLVKGTALLFLVPAFSFLIGAVIGQILVEGIAFSLFLAFVFLACVSLFLYLRDKKYGKKIERPRIIAILSSGK
mgnify:CR=1 FL=1